MSDMQQFMKTFHEAVENFPKNKLVQLLESKQLTLQHYHQILLMIFHQTFQGPSTFSFAGAHCPLELHAIRDYLLHHADEEKNHWEWVIGDLKNTGYEGPDPRSLFPKTACQAYIAFNFYIAMKHPVSRLAVAAVLESIGANYGKKYATQVIHELQLKPNQVAFFLGHGDTDVGHTEDIFNILKQANLTERDYRWMCHAAKTAGLLYKNMYDEALTL